jgi:hypothetical protein
VARTLGSSCTNSNLGHDVAKWGFTSQVPGTSKQMFRNQSRFLPHLHLFAPVEQHSWDMSQVSHTQVSYGPGGWHDRTRIHLFFSPNISLKHVKAHRKLLHARAHTHTHLSPGCRPPTCWPCWLGLVVLEVGLQKFLSAKNHKNIKEQLNSHWKW